MDDSAGRSVFEAVFAEELATGAGSFWLDGSGGGDCGDGEGDTEVGDGPKLPASSMSPIFSKPWALISAFFASSINNLRLERLSKYHFHPTNSVSTRQVQIVTQTPMKARCEPMEPEDIDIRC